MGKKREARAAAGSLPTCQIERDKDKHTHSHTVRCLIRALSAEEQAAQALLREQPDLVLLASSTGETALHFFAIENGERAVTFLLGHGASVDQQTQSGETAVMYAAWLGLAGMATLLVDAGADVCKADENGDTALHRAARSGSVPVVELLLRNGADAKAMNTIGEVPADVALPRKRGLILEAFANTRV